MGIVTGYHRFMHYPVTMPSSNLRNIFLRARGVIAVGLALVLLASAPRASTAFAAAAPPPQAVSFYVAPNGSDAWSGKRPAPNAAKTDGPFATIEAAQQAARRLRSSDAGKSITVRLRGGFYALPRTLTFTAADADGQKAPTVYAAFPGEAPVLSGGTRLGGWKRVGATNRWETTVPEVAAGKWYFSQLSINGERRYRPRIPKTGYYYVGGELASDGQPGTNRLHYTGGTEIRADWHALGDTEALPFHLWEMSRFHVTAIDTAAKTIAFAGRSPVVPSGYRFLIENVREALSESGQWYLDRATGVLTYLSRPGENPNREMVVAPRLEKLVEMTDTKGMIFRGLTFADAAFDLPPQGHSDPQADINVGAAIHLDHARGCDFERCVVRNVGGYGIEMGRGCQNCRVDGCALTDLGAGGVRVGVPENGKPDAAANDAEENDRTVANAVTDCRITHGGRLHPAAVGVLLGNASYTTVAHNAIADFYYTGISVGWSWGYGPSGAHHNTIAGNDISAIGQGVLSDMGGIYTLGVSPGTVLTGNRIHDVVSYDYGGWGIYFDEGSTGIVARDNVVYDLKSEPLHQHYGTLNVLENCILAGGREAQLRRSRGDNGPQATPDKRADTSFTIRHCLIYAQGGAPLFNGNWDGTNFTLEGNLYGSDDGKHPVRFPGNRTLEAWQSAGHDAGSLVADPRFADPARGDFALRPDSPAGKIGFRPIPKGAVGPRVTFPFADAAVPRAFPPPPPPPPIADDFEETGVGEKPGGLNVVVAEETDHPAATIRVTDAVALSGGHSLKFQDAPDQRFPYSPHLYYHPAYATGTWTGRFALRLEPGAIFYHEWRDGASPYNVGPSLAVGADELLTAGGKPLLKLPRGQFVRFTVTCALGDAANGTYDLTVEIPGDAVPHRFPKLSCPSGAVFNTLDWWGFVANSTSSTTFYLDDIALTAKSTAK